MYDDGFGVGEALNERAYGLGLIVRGSSYFVFGPKKSSGKLSTKATERFIQLKTLLPSWMLFSNVSHLSYDVWSSEYTHNVSLFLKCYLINLC